MPANAMQAGRQRYYASSMHPPDSTRSQKASLMRSSMPPPPLDCTNWLMSKPAQKRPAEMSKARGETSTEESCEQWLALGYARRRRRQQRRRRPSARTAGACDDDRLHILPCMRLAQVVEQALQHCGQQGRGAE